MVVYIVKVINLEDLINLITLKTNLIFWRLIIAYWDVGKRMTQCPVPKNGLMKMCSESTMVLVTIETNVSTVIMDRQITGAYTYG